MSTYLERRDLAARPARPRSATFLPIVSIVLIAGVPAIQWLETSIRLIPARVTDLYSVLALVAVLAILIWTYREFLRSFVRYLLTHLGQAFVLVLMMLLLWGQLGVGLGIPNLIWDETTWGRLASGFGATLLLSLLGTNAYYLGIRRNEEDRDELMRKMETFLDSRSMHWRFDTWLEPDRQEIDRHQLSTFLRVARLPFLMLISLPALFPRPFYYVPWQAPVLPDRLPDRLTRHLTGNVRVDVGAYGYGLFVWVIGILAGVLLVKLLIRVSSVLDRRAGEARAEPPADDPSRAGARRWQGARRVWRGTRALGGFRNYLVIVVAVYAFMALAGTRVGGACAVAAFVLAASYSLWNLYRHEGLFSADFGTTLLLALLVAGFGASAIMYPYESPSFSLFAALGLVATVLVVHRLRDTRPITFLFVAVLVVVAAGLLWKLYAREPISTPEALLPACLLPVLYFDLAGRRLRAGPERGGTMGIAGVLAKALIIHLALVLAALAAHGDVWNSLARDLPLVLLAFLFCLVGCFAIWPANGSVRIGQEREHETRRWLVHCAALALWVMLANYDPFKERFDDLEPAYSGTREPVSDILLQRYPYDIIDFTKPETKTGKLPADTLIENADVLEAWKGRLGQERPKLVLVCVSGGAIRSAYWTLTVLDRLGQHLRGVPSSPKADVNANPDPNTKPIPNPGFHDHVRLITGASGGMVGAAYYVASLRNTLPPAPGDPPQPLSFRAADCDLPLKSLNPVARYLALQSPWRMLLPRLPRPFASDRGLVLERHWEAIDKLTFADLNGREAEGAIPSLVYSPMIVDDGRRLLISNLNLMGHEGLRDADDEDRNRDGRVDRVDQQLRVRAEWPIPVARHNDLDNDNNGMLRNTISISALELFKLVPDSRNLRLATAARMSATFPLVSPAVNLPTDPPLRVVDAGYYDNYGVHLANAWILQNRDWLRQNTSGVLVVQIRDSVSKRDRLGVPSEARGFVDRLFQGVQFFGSVRDALLRARYTTNTFRNDQEFIAVNEVFRQMETGPAFVSTVVFENSAYLGGTGDDRGKATRWPGLDVARVGSAGDDIPMSWYLTTSEKSAIEQAIPNEPGPEQYTQMLSNFARNWRDSYPDDPLKALKTAMNLASMAQGLATYIDRSDYDDARAKALFEHFLALGNVLKHLQDTVPLQGPAKTLPLKEIESLGQRLVEWADAKDRPRATEIRNRYFKPNPPAVSKSDTKWLGLLIENAIDLKTTPLDEKLVLLHAHSQWINQQAGFQDRTKPLTEREKAYYTREFERVMNYHRLEAVKSWWKGRHEKANER